VTSLITVANFDSFTLYVSHGEPDGHCVSKCYSVPSPVPVEGALQLRSVHAFSSVCKSLPQACVLLQTVS
jgi:hypothetical protein